MNASAIIRKATEPNPYTMDSVIRFEEGLIGFSECKDFVLMEKDDIAPFRRLQSTEKKEIGFLVLDPTQVVADYYAIIPQRDWDSLGLKDPASKIVLAICIIGPSPLESTGNFQAPLIINCENMTGKQLILTENGLSSRHPLL